MSHAMERAEECGVLKTHPLLTFTANGFNYRIERKGNESFYSVTNGKDTLTLPIHYAFGLGAAGQTYVLEKDGVYYESFVSYYRQPDALDITIGDQKMRPTNLTEALGRRLGERERLACFECHSTDAVHGSKLTLDTMVPGVQCERCHGDTTAHLNGFKTGDASSGAMKHLSAMSTDETSTFCGQCHRTWEQISINGPRGLLNVRFQPYRLTYSRCYDLEDKRISCVGCHDPHKEVDRVTKNYDTKCLACHAGGKPKALPCKVAKQDCASCHMPKFEIPGSHYQFSDHDIRIVKVNSGYPD
jgi:Cytochrome c554 and c-prime